MTTKSNQSFPLKIGEFTGEPNEVRIMTLNPAHFHAALVQKFRVPQVDNTVYIYGPEGPDLDMHLDRIKDFNSRDENPTNWKLKVYRGDDYLERMLEERPGNVMITAGNNGLKTNYIKQAVDHGIHVLSDKPMAIDKQGWELLVDAFESAEKNQALLYDIMTERKEVTSTIQRLLAQNPKLFGELRKGSADEPSIAQKNTHHLLKKVSGKTLRRPPWYFDIKQQGEGIVDITTHLVDLVMWGAFPEQAIDYKKDVEMLEANRRPTVISRDQFEEITGHSDFPSYLHNQLVNGDLPYYSNGDLLFNLKGHYTKIGVQWDYKAPPNGGDNHYSLMRGTLSDLVIRQGPEQNFISTLFVEPDNNVDRAALKSELEKAVHDLQEDFAGLGFEESEQGWKLTIPDKYYLGHEAHFSKVAEAFFGFLVDGKLPDWEVPNMIAKYYITTSAREIALQDS